jgi:glycosyltransferase involved in cell wall biosynthesis
VRPPNALVGDDPDELAAALVRFLTDAELRRRVGAANRDLATREHDIRTQSQRLSAAFATHETPA